MTAPSSFHIPELAAVILAGGRGERLGGVLKAGLLIDDETLLARALRVVAPAQSVLVSHGHHDAALFGVPAGIDAVADLASDYAGPLAGVATAVAWCTARPVSPALLLTVAVDTPFLPHDYAERMVAGLAHGAACALAVSGGVEHPTHGIWRIAALAGLPAAVATGTAPHSLRRLAAGLGAVRVEWPVDAAGDPFAGINTPAELDAARQRAGRSELGK